MKHRGTVAALAIVPAALAPVSARAAEGDCHTIFGTDGEVTTSIAYGRD